MFEDSRMCLFWENPGVEHRPPRPPRQLALIIGVPSIAFYLGNKDWNRPESVSYIKPRICKWLLNRYFPWLNKLQRIQTVKMCPISVV